MTIDVDDFAARSSEQTDEAELMPWTTKDEEMTALVAANPWHDEVGKFAPKGTGHRSRITTMPNDVSVKRLPSHPNVGYVQVGGMTVAKVRDRIAFYVDPDTGRLAKTGDRSGREEMQQVETVMGNLGTLYGDQAKPYVTVTMEPPPMRGVAGLTRGTDHYPTQESEIEIFAMETRALAAGAYPLWDGPLMPSIKTVPPVVYIATHEYGHAHAASMTPEQRGRMGIMWSEHKAGLGSYGRFSQEEAYAEAFAEWHVTNGATTNADVRAYAQEFGWKTL